MTESDPQVPAEVAAEPKPVTAEEFAQAYKLLCKQLGFQVSFEPAWSRSADMGDYRLVVRVGIERMPK